MGFCFEANPAFRSIFFVCHPERLPVGRQAVEGLLNKTKKDDTSIRARAIDSTRTLAENEIVHAMLFRNALSQENI